MKIRSAILTEMSGSVGGITASRSRGNNQYLRARVTPANPRTPLQTMVRNAAAAVADDWKSFMTQEQRDGWNALAAGSQKSGQNLFCQTSQRLAYAQASGLDMAIGGGNILSIPFWEDPVPSLTTPLTAPVTVIDASANSLSVTVNQGDPYIADTDVASSQQGLLYVRATLPQSPSRSSRQHPFRLVGVYVWGDVGAASPAIDLASLGIPTNTGDVIYVEYTAQHYLGGISVPQIQRITVTA